MIFHKGHHFTWWNKQDSNPIAKKLDRVLANDTWLLTFPLSFSEFMEPKFSDHSPSCVHLGRQVQEKRRPLMFSNFLLHHSGFISHISEAWNNMQVQGTAMFVLSKKLKLLKSIIKSFHKENYSGLEKRVMEAAKELSSCQSNFLNSPSPQLAKLEKAAHIKWLELALAEERFLCQRSQVSWLANGDGNYAFFHRIVAARRATNQIHYLLASGQKIDQQEDISSHCVGYYSELLEGNSKSLSHEDIDIIRSMSSFQCTGQMMDLLLAGVSQEDIFFQPIKCLVRMATIHNSLRLLRTFLAMK